MRPNEQAEMEDSQDFAIRRNIGREAEKRGIRKRAYLAVSAALAVWYTGLNSTCLDVVH
jgi:hypothetical protein